MKCNLCGFDVEAGQNMCPNCGAPITNESNDNNEIFTNPVVDEPVVHPVDVPVVENNPQFVEQSVNNNPVFEQSVAEQPVEVPVTEMFEQPVVEQPVEVPVTEMFEQPVVEQPVEVPTTEMFEQPVVEQPVEVPTTEMFEQPAAEHSVEVPVIETFEQPVVEQPVETPVMDTIDQSIFEQPTEIPVMDTIDQSAFEQPAEAPVTEMFEQPVAEQPVEAPAAESIEQSVVEQPVETPVAEQPVETPVAEQPVETPVEESIEQPVVEQPIGTPVAESIEQPVVEQPVETPVTESIEQPVETPVTPVEQSTTAEKADGEMAPLFDTPKKKSKVGTVILIIILVLVLAAGGLFAYFHFLYGNPAKVFDRTFDTFFTEVGNKITESRDNKKLQAITTVSLNGYPEDVEKTLSNLVLKYDFNVNSKTKEANANLGLRIDGEEINANIYSNDTSVYVKVDSIFSKYFRIISEDTKDGLDTIFNHTAEYERVVKKTKEIIAKELDLDSISKKYVKESINGKEVLTAKTTLDLDAAKLNELFKKIFTDMKSDDQFVTDLATINDNPKEIQISLLETEISTLSLKSGITLNVYTNLTTSELLKFEMVLKAENESTTIDYVKSNDGMIINLISNEIKMNLNTDKKTFDISFFNDDKSIALKTTYQYNDEPFVAPDVNDNVLFTDLDSLSKDDQQEITDNLENSKFLSELSDLFSTDFSSFDSSSEKDNDYNSEFNKSLSTSDENEQEKNDISYKGDL